MLRFVAFLISTLFLLAIVIAGGVLALFWRYGQDLPDYRQLAHYEPSVTTRVYAGDGRLVAEYATEHRSFVPIEVIPKRVINAFLAAEDKNFYSHSGVDPIGIVRAGIIDLRNRGMGTDRRPVGASTITQQVAKNFLLTNEVSIERKIKEALLAFRIERSFTKDHILELYLNEIYLGQGSYGIAAAAMNYFNKGLDELTVAQAAFLGGLPKAPNSYNPERNLEASQNRRDWVIDRMADDGFISPAEASAAKLEPLTTETRSESQLVSGGDYFAEDIRREIAADYGEDALYGGGLSVRSTLDPGLQQIAAKTLRAGLIAYDRRHGWRGALGHMDPGPGWMARLKAQGPLPGQDSWMRAVVLTVSDKNVEIGFANGNKGHIPMSELAWARPDLSEQRYGTPPKHPSDVLNAGDLILVEPVVKSDDGKEHYGPETYGLRQIPKIEGALVALDPHTGRVLAMQGGYSYARSQFNRATQALRQPGSSFKPFVYMAALDSGFTPSSLILDGPIALPQGPGLPLWRPLNYEHDYLGPSTMRVGIEKSRNLMTVRMAASIGMDKVASYAERFGVVDQLPHFVSMALSAGVTTPLRLTSAYAQIVNGGKKITPTLIDRIQDRDGKTIYRHDDRPCDGCQATFYTDQDMPQIPDTREQLVDPMTAYQMVHILEGVVERGTGRIVSEVGKPLAGKTGTSNESRDTWFVGFAPDLAVGVFVGFDDDSTLGHHETGATAAAPIFRDFMAAALKDKPPTPFRIPPGIRFVRVDAHTGKPVEPGDKNVIMEAFKPGNLPSGTSASDVVLDNGSGIANPNAKPGDLATLGKADEQADEDAESQPDDAPSANGIAPGPVASAPIPVPATVSGSQIGASVGSSQGAALLARPPDQASPQAGGLY